MRRQLQDGENGDDGNGDSETPEDTEEVDATETPVPAADVVINNTTYHIADNFTEEQIPADFTEATVKFPGSGMQRSDIQQGNDLSDLSGNRQCGRNDRQIFYL